MKLTSANDTKDIIYVKLNIYSTLFLLGHMKSINFQIHLFFGKLFIQKD